MNQKHCLLVMALAGVLSLAPLPAFSGNLSNFSDALEQLADMTRAADRPMMPLTTLCRGAGITAGMIGIGAMPSHASNGRESARWRTSRE